MAKRLFILAFIGAALAAFLVFDLGRYLSLDALKVQQSALNAQRDAQPLLFALGFFVVYTGATALSFPGAAVLTLAAGALFGVVQGTILVSFASTAGATLAFLAARYVLRDSLQKRYGERLTAINAGVEKEGAFYLFTLRLVPIFPFFLVNLVMGLTPIKTLTYIWVSQVGMLLGTIAFVNAGTELVEINSLKGILSPSLVGAFVFMGILPLVARRIIDTMRARKVYKPFNKPSSFDRNLIVIGAGAGGLVTSYIAAAVKAKVTLIEKSEMGGDCLNFGCVPSKALLRSAKLVSHIQRAAEFGLKTTEVQVDFAAVMERVKHIIAEVAPHDSVERYTQLGVECINGEAKLLDPWTVQVNGKKLTAPNIVLATGAAPFVPNIPGLKEAGYLTSDTLWELRELPKRLIVLGGGPIGCEMTQAFARLGAKVTQVEMQSRLLLREDPEVSDLVTQRFLHEGVVVRTGTKAKAVVIENGQRYLVCESNGVDEKIPFDHILVAVGRAARLTGYGLQELGVKTGKTIEVNESLQTNFPNIYAVGDVAGPFQFTHTAAHMAWYAAVNSLFGKILWLRGGLFKVDYSVVPWATFTEPEVARVGLNETDAKEKNIAYEVVKYGLDDLDRAIADGEAHGFVKVLTVPGSDKILGVTIVGEHAGDLLAEYVLAMKYGLGMNKILGTIHTYPTLSEANKYAAGLWKQAHKPEGLLRWVQKLHSYFVA